MVHLIRSATEDEWTLEVRLSLLKEDGGRSTIGVTSETYVHTISVLTIDHGEPFVQIVDLVSRISVLEKESQNVRDEQRSRYIQS